LQKAPPRWRRLANWGELSRCEKLRIRWPKRDALMGGAPRNAALVAASDGEIAPTEGYTPCEPETRPDKFEWREGVPSEGRKVELDGGGVVDLPSKLAAFEGYLP